MGVHSRTNGLAATLANDDVALGLLDNAYSPPLVELSVSLGHPGEIDHPEVREAVETVRSKALEAGVPVGGLAFGTDDATEKAADGYQILNLGSTAGALQQTVRGWLDAYESPADGEP